MRKTTLLLIVLITTGLVGSLIWGYLARREGKSAESETEKSSELGPSIANAAKADGTLRLNDEAQKRLALKVEPLKAAQAAAELTAYGRVLDPAPLAALVTELTAAEIALEASNKEYERLKVLHAQQNASTRALQAVDATVRRDQLAVRGVRERLITSWGKEIAERTDLADWVQALIQMNQALVRIDLPAGRHLAAPPATARLAAINPDEDSLAAKFLAPAPNVEAQTQGQGFFYLLQTNPPNLRPGAAVVGFLASQAAPLDGVLVPRSAVVRTDGQTWVYVQRDALTFVRRKISFDQAIAGAWFVREGVKPGDRVVVTGAQELLTEERKSEIRMID